MAVVVIVVLLAVPCLVAVLLGGFLYVGSSRQLVVIAPTPTAVPRARLVVVEIDADEQVLLDGAKVQSADLPNQLRQLQAMEYRNGSSLSVMVRSDSSVPYGIAQEVLDRIAEVGVPYSLHSIDSASAMGTAAMPGGGAEEAGAETPESASAEAEPAAAATSDDKDESKSESSEPDTPAADKASAEELPEER